MWCIFVLPRLFHAQAPARDQVAAGAPKEQEANERPKQEKEQSTEGKEREKQEQERPPEEQPRASGGGGTCSAGEGEAQPQAKPAPADGSGSLIARVSNPPDATQYTVVATPASSPAFSFPDGTRAWHRADSSHTYVSAVVYKAKGHAPITLNVGDNLSVRVRKRKTERVVACRLGTIALQPRPGHVPDLEFVVIPRGEKARQAKPSALVLDAVKPLAAEPADKAEIEALLAATDKWVIKNHIDRAAAASLRAAQKESEKPHWLRPKSAPAAAAPSPAGPPRPRKRPKGRTTARGSDRDRDGHRDAENDADRDRDRDKDRERDRDHRGSKSPSTPGSGSSSAKEHPRPRGRSRDRQWGDDPRRPSRSGSPGPAPLSPRSSQRSGGRSPSARRDGDRNREGGTERDTDRGADSDRERQRERDRRRDRDAARSGDTHASCTQAHQAVAPIIIILNPQAGTHGSMHSALDALRSLPRLL